MSTEKQNTPVDLSESMEEGPMNVASGPSLSNHHENLVSLAPSHEILYPQVNNPEDHTQDNRKNISSFKDQIFGEFSSKRKVSESREPLVSDRRSGWKNLTSLEKALSVALGLVSTLAIALMIAVIVVGVKLNEDDYQPPTKPVASTKYPPWVTTISTIPPISEGPEVTTKERPTSQPPSTTSVYTFETCVSTECFRAAGDIKLSMDLSVKPCDDFYQFSCGGWIKNNPIPESKTSINQFDKIQDRLNLEIKTILEANSLSSDTKDILMAKQYYETCLTQDDQMDDQNTVRKLINEMITNSENDTIRPLAVILANIRKELGGNYIFNLQIDTDLQDMDKTAIYLDHLEFGLVPAYLQENSTEEHLSAYKRLIMNFWITIFPNTEAVGLELIVENIIKFEKNLLDISSSRYQERKEPLVKIFNTAMYESTFDTRNIDTSEGETWKYFVDEVMEEIIYNCTETECETLEDIGAPNVILKDLEFFDKIDALLNDTETNIIHDYLKWRIILDYAKEGSEDFRMLLSLHDQKIQDTQYISSRWENCVEKANYFFGSAIANVYIKEKVKDPVSFKYKLSEMTQTLKTAFYDILQEAPWLTMETHDMVLGRLDDLKIFLGYSESYENLTHNLDTENRLNFKNSSSHFQNVLDLIKWRNEKELRTILLTSNELVSMKNAEIQTTIGSSYSSLSNSIYFPMGIFDAPIFRDLENDTLALNYGSMGMLVARMLIDAFEDTAASYINETLIAMWDSETLDGFENSTDCLKGQYSRFNVSELNDTISVDGKNTVQMNTADLGGLKIALRAYASQKEPFKDHMLPGLKFTPDQLFYLSFAQTWCSAYTPERLFTEVVTGSQAPASYRVRGVLENSEEFLDTWNCPFEEEKGLCRIW